MAKKYGLVAALDERVFEIRLSAAAFATSGLFDPANATAQLLTRYQFNPLTDPERTGIYMSVVSDYQNDQMEWLFEIDDLSISYSDTDAGHAASGKLTAKFYNLRLYSWYEIVGLTEDVGWRLDFSEVELFKNDVSVGSWDNSGSGYSIHTSILNPSSIPLMGIPPRVQAKAAPGPLLPSGPGGTAFSFSSSCTASGGFRDLWLGEGSHVAYPVEATVEVFTGSCACATETPTAPSGADTWNLTAHSALGAEETIEEGDWVICESPCGGPDASYRIDYAELRSWDWYGSIVGVPNLERAIERMNPDYGALWHRFRLPKAEVGLVTTCKEGEAEDSAVTTVYNDTVELIAEQAPILQRVDNSAAAIEDTFGFDVPAPYYFYSHERLVTSEYVVEGDPVEICPPPIGVWTCAPEGDYPITTFCESIKIADFAGADSPGSGDVTYLDSTGPTARLVDFLGSPHWSFTFGFDDWSGLDEDEYWKKCRYQWQDVGAGARSNKRNSIVNSALNDGGFKSLQDQSWAGFRWIGDHRFQVDEVTPLASYEYDDSLDASMIEATDCTVALGASNITVNPSALTCSFKLRLSSFEHGPRLYPQGCDRQLVDWSMTNVSAVRVYRVSVDGTRVLLENTPGDGFTTKNVTYSTPEAQDEKYAGSWPINNANGQVADEGSDLLPEGISAATMADPERATSFQMLGAYTAEWLEFEIDVVDHTVNVTVEYPVLSFDAGVPGLTYEHGSACNLTYPNGPGWRQGNLQFVIGGSLSETPTVQGLGSHKTTVVDWLAFRNVMLLAVAHDDGLTTELTTLYDSVEGQDVETVDAFSIAYVLPMKAADATIRAALVNMWAEVPPVCTFPFRKRDAKWAATDDHALVSYSFSQEPRYYVSRRRHLNIKTGVNNWTAPTTAPATGWFRTEHSHVVDNTEIASFKAWAGNKEYADVTPWHGYFAVIEPGGQFSNPWNWQQDQNHYHRAAIGLEDPGVWYFRSHWGHPGFGFDAIVQVTDDEDDSNPRMVCDPLTQTLLLIFDRGGTGIVSCESNDEGDTWSEPAVLIADGHFPTVTVSRDGTVVAAAFVYDSGSSGPGKIKVRVRKMGEPSFSAAAAITDGSSPIAFTADTFHIVQAQLPEQVWVLVARPDGSSDVEEYRSYDDCETFEII